MKPVKITDESQLCYWMVYKVMISVIVSIHLTVWVILFVYVEWCSFVILKMFIVYYLQVCSVKREEYASHNGTWMQW